jgi:acyl carrier protein
MINENKTRKKTVDELFTKILKIPISEISENLTPNNVKNWDSLNHLNLICFFEEEFLIDIEPEEIIEMYKDYKTFKSIVYKKVERVS